MKIGYRESFKKDLLKITDKKLLTRIASEINNIQDAKNLTEISNAKRLRGKGGYFKIRVGDYRLGLIAKDDVVTFVRFLHRKEIYRYFP